MSTQYTIDEFCEKHRACTDGHLWAKENCKDMHEVWLKAKHPSWVLWIADRPNVLSAEDCIKFGLHVAKSVLPLITHPRVNKALAVAERKFAHANTEDDIEKVTDEEYDATLLAVSDYHKDMLLDNGPGPGEKEATDTVMRIVERMTKGLWPSVSHASLCAASAFATKAMVEAGDQVAKWGAWGDTWARANAAHVAWLRANVTPNFDRPVPVAAPADETKTPVSTNPETTTETQ